MNAANEIIKILSAMGANPETKTNATGKTVIKINAPIMNNERNGNNDRVQQNKKING